jgi:hypothetical protein
MGSEMAASFWHVVVLNKNTSPTEETAMPILDERNLSFNNLSEKFADFRSRLSEMFEEEKRLDEVEREAFSLLLQMGLAALRDFVESSGDGDSGETLPKGDKVLKRSDQKHSRSYRSIFGLFEIERFVYSTRKKQKQEAVPLDQKLGLPAAETSYLLEEWMGSVTTYMSYDAGAKWLEDTFGIGGSSTTIENRVLELGEYAEAFRAEVKDELSEDEGEVIAVLADAKGVPIRTPWEQVLEEKLGRKPHVRRHKRDFERTYRKRVRGDQVKTQQATIGVCFSFDRNPRSAKQVLEKKGNDSPALFKNKKLWGEMSRVINGEESRGAVRIFEQLAAHVATRDPNSKREVVCIMDGAVSLWKLQRQYFPQAVPIIDIYHVTKKLWGVAQCLEKKGSQAAEDRVTHYLKMILEGKVDFVRGIFQRFLNQKDWNTTKTEKFQHAIEYFRKNRNAMQYHKYLAKGYPIGSGSVEGACKHVIGDRFCRSGMRWERRGAQSMLHLRTVHLNGNWKTFMEYRVRQEQVALYTESAIAA